ncbi:MAG: beta-ketoacyl-ACP synthase II [Prevotellaceae bacterium]|jgi:3-oxoacyl-[acyl-carrier-protein] synthase II|nr:beta-ketoacyl-ACP synthase II [Prevotellaceae bacterium]
MELKRVVITGIGTINALGNTVKEYYDNLLAGVSGANLITYFDTTNYKTKFACEVKSYDAANYPELFDRKEARKLDLYAQFGMVAAYQAVVDSGLEHDKIDLNQAGVIWASGIGGIRTFFDEVKGYIEGGSIPRFSPFFVPKMISDIAAGHISMKLGFRGPNYATTSACASSNNSIIDAFNLIRLGKADIIIAGGSESAVNEAGIGGFNACQALSTRNDEYLTASRPFDQTRDGFVMGEGAAGLILEEYEYAKARGAKIYGEIIGGGMSADAFHLTAPHPDGLGAKSAMLNAIKDAGIRVEDIDYVNVHGTSTPIGDVAELKAVQGVFGEHAYKVNISSTKSMTGHLLGAAGAVEALACLCAMERSLIPPTINHSVVDPEIDPKLNLTLNKAQERKVNIALSNAFGFGGHNATILIKKI